MKLERQDAIILAGTCAVAVSAVCAFARWSAFARWKTRSLSLDDVADRAENSTSPWAVKTRLHKLPRKLEDDYIVDKTVLGSGISGSIVLAASKGHGTKCAVKTLGLQKLDSYEIEHLESELQIFLTMDHPHVVRLFDVYVEKASLRLVMECLEGGDLMAQLSQRGRFSDTDAAPLVWQMLLALNYLHALSVAHRDIKLDNFLCEIGEPLYLKLTDFGFGATHTDNLDLALGSPYYVAPEVLGSAGYTSQCDLWSLGVVVFALLAGDFPFRGGDADETLQLARNCRYDIQKIGAVSADAQDFVLKLLVLDYRARLTAANALVHPWVKKVVRRATIRRNTGVGDEVVHALCEFASISCFKRACFSVMALALSREERAKVCDTFIDFDTDNTGGIEIQELRAVLQSRDIDERKIQQIFSALDTSGDGIVEYSEFLAAMLSSHIDITQELMAKTFRKLDEDQDGYISVADVKAVIGERFAGLDTQELLVEPGLDANRDGKISLQEFCAFVRPADSC